jgi:hypothetical protein
MILSKDRGKTYNKYHRRIGEENPASKITDGLIIIKINAEASIELTD